MMIVEGIGLGFKSINLNNKSLNFSMDLMFEVTIEIDFPSGNENEEQICHLDGTWETQKVS